MYVLNMNIKHCAGVSINKDFNFQLESAGIKFNDLRGTGVSLRSQRMKLPANVGQKKTKALEQTLNEFKVGK